MRNAVGRPMPGLGSPALAHRIVELFRDWFPDDLSSGICNQWPDALERTSGKRGSCENCHILVHGSQDWHHIIILSLNNDGDSPCSIRESSAQFFA